MPAEPRVWQRTDTVGTELVIPDGDNRVSGTAVVSGPKPYATRWQVWLSDDHAVRALEVVCEGHGWRRELRLSSDGCRTQATGDLDAPEPGLADPSRLAGAVIRLAASPVFLSWAMRALQLESGEKTAPTALVLTPSLTVVVGESRYQRLGDHRLRVSGDEPAATYDLDGDGMVTYQPGRLRGVR
ncbi:putative glycolipid-binding domain-containing protein [Actinoplanes sp. TBRC 11911]|uniref:putative glycolipid-binding domain-containing protein n=1 Tax=Actinoplanes sp. TBRC 11911 TaxID=2729386 RepID=UPI00145F4F55|nr:putative glycolipid-binding domain-containing protein [Actinoplanes sp. TBRC 11911]NMO55317.1 putative glycolipid-binding domain-containing protein [Actinoplanes sp. TBRC 11911]